MATKPTAATELPGERVCVLDRRAMLALWLDLQVERGKMTAQQALRYAEDKRDEWVGDFKEKPSETLNSAENAWSVVKDAKDIRALAKEVGWLGRYYVKEYGGKQYVILKGQAALRKALTGTRYGVENAKIVSMKIGPAAQRITKSAPVFSLVFCTATNIVDYFVGDRMTLIELFGGIASDIAKCLIAAGAGAAAGALFAAGAAALGFTVVAVGPLIAALAVGLLVGWALDELWERYQIEERLTQKLQQAVDTFRSVSRRIEASGRNAWQGVVNSRIVADLSRETHELADDLQHGLDRVRWEFRKVF